MSGEWWHDFENQLGNLDVRKYVQKYTPPEKSIAEILEEIEKQREFENKYNLPPSMIPETPCAERLRGLLDVLQYCFEQWVDYSQRRITVPNYINIEKNDSYFINFNYTDVLECIYKIPEERVLHIHGRASKHEHLIFGHGKRLNADVILSHDEQETCEELNRYNKNPYEYIYKHNDLPEKLKDVEYVHVYGFSISQVDENYLDWIEMKTPRNSQWEFSWYSDEDRNRIDRFIRNHYRLENRVKMIRLEDIKIKERFDGELVI